MLWDFLNFRLLDPDLEPVGVQVEIKPPALVHAEEEAVKEEDTDKPYWEP